MNNQLLLPSFLYQQARGATRLVFVTAVLETTKRVKLRMRGTDGIQSPTPESGRSYAEFVARHHPYR